MQNAIPTHVIEMGNQLEHVAYELACAMLSLDHHPSIWNTVSRRAEKGAARAILERANGNISLSALALGVNRNTLATRVTEFGIDIAAVRKGGDA